jgi:TolB-like protein
MITPATSQITKHVPRAHRHGSLARLAFVLAACFMVAGCASPGGHALLTHDYQPQNIFTYSHMPANFQRVAVLPLACETRCADLPEGCEALNPVLIAELAKAKQFEVISVNPEMLRSRTGRSSWTGAEVLPADFFDSLHRSYGCDAVLFCQLTVFRAYAPLAVGWRMKMVDTRTRQILWAADELFDAGEPAVLNGARHYQKAELRTSPLEDWSIRNSPREFGQYAAAQHAARLPGQQKSR